MRKLDSLERRCWPASLEGEVASLKRQLADTRNASSIRTRRSGARQTTKNGGVL